MTTITTAAELDALPVGSVVARLHNDGRGNSVYTLHWDGWYSATEPLRPWVGDASDQCDGRMPDLTVIYRPIEPEPAKPTEAPYWCCRNCVAGALQDAYAEWARRVEADGYMPETEYDAMADAVLAPLSVIPGQNPAELAAHDAEVAAKALEDAADAALSDTEGKLLPGVVGASWLRSRAAAIRAEVQR